MKFTFSGKELRAVVKTSLKDNCQLPYGQGPSEQRGVWLVNDAGVYLMPANSKGIPKHIAYAQGFKDEGLYGDDFAEFIPLSIGQLDRIINGNRPLYVEVSENSLKVTA